MRHKTLARQDVRALLLLAIVIASLPFILRQPHIGVYVWSWIGYMNPHRLAWSALPFAEMAAGATLIAMLFTKESRKIPWTRESVLLLTFVVWMFITTLFADLQYWAWFKWDKVWKVMLFVFITMMFITDKKRLQILIWVIVLSLGFYGVKGGIFTIQTGGAHRVLGPGGSFIGTRGEIGTALNMMIPLMRYLQLSTPVWWVKHGMTAAIGLTVFAVVGTSSRGAALGLAAVSLILLFKSRGKLLLIVMMAVVGYAAYNFVPEEWKARMHTIETYEEDGSAMGRIDAWKYAIKVANASPIVGGGFEVTAGRRAAHSIYFQILGEHGYVGLFLFLLLLFFTWRTASWVRRKSKKHEGLRWAGDLAAMLQVSMVAYMVGGAFISQAYFDLIYHFVAIVVILQVLTLKYLAGSEKDEEDKSDQVGGNKDRAMKYGNVTIRS